MSYTSAGLIIVIGAGGNVDIEGAIEDPYDDGGGASMGVVVCSMYGALPDTVFK